MAYAQKPIDAILNYVYKLFQSYVKGWINKADLQNEPPPLVIPADPQNDKDG